MTAHFVKKNLAPRYNMSNSNNNTPFQRVKEPQGTRITIGSKEHHFNTRDLRNYVGKEMHRILLGKNPRHPKTGKNMSMQLFLNMYRRVTPYGDALYVHVNGMYSHRGQLNRHFESAIQRGDWKSINELDKIHEFKDIDAAVIKAIARSLTTQRLQQNTHFHQYVARHDSTFAKSLREYLTALPMNQTSDNTVSKLVPVMMYPIIRKGYDSYKFFSQLLSQNNSARRNLTREYTTLRANVAGITQEAFIRGDVKSLKAIIDNLRAWRGTTLHQTRQLSLRDVYDIAGIGQMRIYGYTDSSNRNSDRVEGVVDCTIYLWKTFEFDIMGEARAVARFNTTTNLVYYMSYIDACLTYILRRSKRVNGSAVPTVKAHIRKLTRAIGRDPIRTTGLPHTNMTLFGMAAKHMGGVMNENFVITKQELVNIFKSLRFDPYKGSPSPYETLGFQWFGRRTRKLPLHDRASAIDIASLERIPLNNARVIHPYMNTSIRHIYDKSTVNGILRRSGFNNNNGNMQPTMPKHPVTRKEFTPNDVYKLKTLLNPKEQKVYRTLYNQSARNENVMVNWARAKVKEEEAAKRKKRSRNNNNGGNKQRQKKK
jgi:hypothetical protein